jgi:excisionase family DNA binding protein
MSKKQSDRGGKQEWFTPAEAADYLRVTRQTIYNYMDQGILPYYEIKIGRGRRLRRQDLEALLQRSSQEEE